MAAASGMARGRTGPEILGGFCLDSGSSPGQKAGGPRFCWVSSRFYFLGYFRYSVRMNFRFPGIVT